MIYITGDTHIPVDIGKLSSKRFPEQKKLTERDYVIICGDFGGVWADNGEQRYWLRWLGGKNFTTLFVDGNHENFDLLGTYPVVEFCCGQAHRIGEKIFHLMRGNVFCIDGMKIFTFGGAESHDKEIRKEGKNWWKSELPTENELAYARENLDRYGWSVDYVITHCAPTEIQRLIQADYGENILTGFFDAIDRRLAFKKWFFGHYHRDEVVDSRHRAVFEDVIELRRILDNGHWADK